MNKRERIKQKYDGLCAYSGTPLEDDWQVDHMEPLIREPNGSYMFRNADQESNMVPCQRIINHYKGNWSFNQFREYMLTLHERLAKLPVNPYAKQSIKRKQYLLKVASYFGITATKPFNGVFYFEPKEAK